MSPIDVEHLQQILSNERDNWVLVPPEAAEIEIRHLSVTQTKTKTQ